MSRYNVLRLGKFATFLILILLWASAAPIDARIERDNGIVRIKSAVPMSEAIIRIKADIAAKGIKFFDEIDQSNLAADAGIKLRPSTLLVFGNPPLGTQFITSDPNAGLDWPVRLLLTQDDDGDDVRANCLDAVIGLDYGSDIEPAIGTPVAAEKHHGHGTPFDE